VFVNFQLFKKWFRGVQEAPGLQDYAKSVQEGHESEREFFIDNLLVRIHFIIVMFSWTGLAPWEFEFPFPGSLTSTFLALNESTCVCGST